MCLQMWFSGVETSVSLNSVSMCWPALSHVSFPEDFKELSFEKEKFELMKTRITSGSLIEKNRNKLLLACSTLLLGAFPSQRSGFVFLIPKGEVTSVMSWER